MIEHHIQRNIIELLATAPQLRFSELKPQDVESNAFIYHLKQLIKQNLVEKTPDGYKLSNSGLRYLDSYSFRTRTVRKWPKVISILVVKRADGNYVLAKRKYQPYIGQFMFVSGKQHFGESPEYHVRRELQEKLAIAAPLNRRGMADIRIYHGDALITHVIAHVYEATVEMNEPPAPTNQFEYVWARPDDPDLHVVAGTVELLAKLESEKSLFFLSLDVQDK